MKEKDKEKLIAIRVRLMGAPLRGHVYFVAKDLCQLIHSRATWPRYGRNTICPSQERAARSSTRNEKARMPVLCPALQRHICPRTR